LPQEHGVEPEETDCLAVQLPHLGEHVGLLDPVGAGNPVTAADLATFL
jgi:hypothetical protein